MRISADLIQANAVLARISADLFQISADFGRMISADLVQISADWCGRESSSCTKITCSYVATRIKCDSRTRTHQEHQ